MKRTCRQRTYVFEYPKSLTNGTSRVLASWRAEATNLEKKDIALLKEKQKHTTKSNPNNVRPNRDDYNKLNCSISKKSNKYQRRDPIIYPMVNHKKEGPRHIESRNNGRRTHFTRRGDHCETFILNPKSKGNKRWLIPWSQNKVVTL